MSLQFARRCNIPTMATSKVVTLADGKRKVKVNTAPKVNFNVGQYDDVISALVLGIDGYDVVLGMPWLTAYNPHINWASRSITFLDSHQKRHNWQADVQPETKLSFSMLSALQLKKCARKNQPIFLCVVKTPGDPVVPVQVPVEKSAVVEKLLKEFSDVFPEDLPKGLPVHRAVDHKIEIAPGSEPPYKQIYRM